MRSLTQDFECPKCGSQGLRTVWTNTPMQIIKYTEECTSSTCDYQWRARWEPADDPIEGYDPHVVLPHRDTDTPDDL